MVVDRAVGLGQPQLNAMELEPRGQVQQLSAVECALVLADDDRVEPPVGVSDCIQ